MIIVHTSIPIEPDHREEALEMTKELVEQSRKEEGTINYRAMTDMVNPNTIRFFEQYEDVESAEAHSQTDHYREWIERLPDMVDGQLENVQFTLDNPPETVRFDIEEAI